MAVRFLFTDRSHGDLSLGAEPAEVLARRRAITEASGLDDVAWTVVRQVHGSRCIVVGQGEVRSVEAAAEGVACDELAEADAIVTAERGLPVAVHAADCAPLLLVAPDALAVVHAGWRGLLAGVVEAAVVSLEALGQTPLRAVAGPTIGPECYEFTGPELADLQRRFGSEVRATTAGGTSALDLRAGVRAAVAEHGLNLEQSEICTACSSRHWSHRARSDSGRQALVAWLM